MSSSKPVAAVKPSSLRAHRRRARRLALTAAAASTVAFTAAPPAAAQPPSQQAPTGLDRSTAIFTFDIAAGSVASVAAAFERLTGVRVTLATPDLAALPAPGVRGVMTAGEALRTALAGTSLDATFGADGVVVDVMRLSENVVVTGTTRPTTVSSPRYTVPLRDIAQTVAVVPRGVIEQRVATTLTDVLRNVPGITLQAGEGGGSSNTAGDMFNMRGFSANNSVFVDNVRDSGLVARDVFNVEQVEVFMGPTGSDVGRGTAAGYVNMQTKRPQAGTSVNFNVIGGTADQGRVAADVNWSAPTTASSSWLSRAAVRLNGLWQDRGVPGRDFVSNESSAIAPSLLLGLGTPTRVVVSSQIMRQDNLPDYGVPSAAWTEDPLATTVVQAPAPVAQTNFYGTPAYDYDRVDQDAYFARVDHDIRRNLTVANQTRYNRTHREALVSAITNVAAYDPATNLVTVTRQGNERENTILSNQSTVVTRFATGTLRHGLSAGVEVLHEQQFSPTLTGVGTRPPTDIFTPDPDVPVTGFAPERTLASTDGTTNSVALYANDSVEIGQRWLVSGGFRVEGYRTAYDALDAAGALTTDLEADGTLWSGRGSVLFRVNDAANVYLSYGSTATPPGEANFQLSSTANNVNNPNVDPQVSTNLELGTKADIGNRLSLTGAVFHTRNRNVIYTVDASLPIPTFNQDDAQIVSGATVGALGKLTDRWQVLANFAYLDAEIDSQGPTDGNRMVLTPAFSGSLWTTYRVLGGLTVGGGVQQVGSAYVNAANTTKVPSYALVDGLVEYAVNSHLTLRLNVYNVGDVRYVRSVNNNGGRYNPGNSRSAMITTAVAF